MNLVIIMSHERNNSKKQGWWSWTSKILTGVGIAAVIASIPHFMGFGVGGVIAGSKAAAIQSIIGNVAAGSLFSMIQSSVMRGIVTAVIATGIVIAVIGVTMILL